MEFLDIGAHCSLSSCNRLDFLPIKCHFCNKLYCKHHYQADVHQCPNVIDNQVTVCPLCRAPITVKRGNQPDLAVNEHLDNYCLSNLASFKNSFFRCSQKGCKVKEVIHIVCCDCNKNFCIQHRHPMDHTCEDYAAAIHKNSHFSQASSKRTFGWQTQEKMSGGKVSEAPIRDSKRKTKQTKNKRRNCCTIC